jgi:hypothetical protein
MEDVKVLSLTLKEVPVKLGEADFILRELTGAQRDSYLDDIAHRTNMVGGKVQGFKTFKGMQSFLIAMSLLNAEGKAVKEDELQKYPASTLTALFKMAIDLNGLNEKDIDEATKN